MNRSIDERKAALLPKVIGEVERWGGRPITMDLDIATLLSIVGALQLAMRHPGFKGHAQSHAYQFVKSIEVAIPEDFPAIKETIGLGFNRDFDCDHAPADPNSFAG